VILTLGADLMVKEDPNAACEILIATIGCNVAWASSTPHST
jgi:hypothetical protein